MASAGHSCETGTPARMHRQIMLFCKSCKAMAKSSSFATSGSGDKVKVEALLVTSSLKTAAVA